MQGAGQRCRGTSSQTASGNVPTNIHAYRTSSFHQSNHLATQMIEPIYEQPRRKVHFKHFNSLTRSSDILYVAVIIKK